MFRIGGAVGAFIINKVLYPCSQFDGLIKLLFIGFNVVVQISIYVPGRFFDSLFDDDIFCFYFLCGAVCFTGFGGEGSDGD